MKFEDVIIIMRDLNVMHVKVIDTQNKRVIDFMEETSVDNTIAKLQGYMGLLSSYGRLTFIGATDAIKKQNWRDAYTWIVTFNGTSAEAPKVNQGVGSFQPMPGYISQNEAALMAQLSALQLQLNFQKQIADLERKLTVPAQEGENMLEKHLPMLGMFMDIDETKMANMMKMAQIQGMMKGSQMPSQTQGIAGPFTGVNQGTQTKIEVTEQEKAQVAEFNKEIDLLSEKASLEKLITLVKGLNANPGFVDMALTFINQPK